jgi:hypothetical protein
MSKFKASIAENLYNFKGWKTKRKIIVFDSDDWGSIRMPSKKVFNELLKSNIRVDLCPFCSFDSLASEDDLTSLFEILRSVKDANGNHPVITANAVMANPDFSRIMDSGFKEYHYEPFTETLKNYSGCRNSFMLWEQGHESKLFFPQLHGREHLNVNRWMKSLNEGSPEILIAFQNKMFGISTSISKEGKKSYLPSFDADNLQDLESHGNILSEAVLIFNASLNYHPKTFVAPNFVWSSHLESHLAIHDIKIIKSSRVQFSPNLANGYNKKHHFTGQRNSNKQLYIVRNCLFEPSFFQKIDWVSNCMKNIQNAFFWNSPAIIGTHRVNYIGSIVEKNRTVNLKFLSELLRAIVKRWPDVEFLSTSQLGSLILLNEQND